MDLLAGGESRQTRQPQMPQFWVLIYRAMATRFQVPEVAATPVTQTSEGRDKEDRNEEDKGPVKFQFKNAR